MKTLTEYFGKTLRDQELLYQESIKATAEDPTQLEAKFGEAVKQEGDKLKLLISALEVVRSQKGALKRVVVSQLAEGEKAPQLKSPQVVFEKDGKVYVIEFFPQQERKGRPDSRDRPGRGDRGGKGGRPGRGGRDGDRKGRTENSDRPHFSRRPDFAGQPSAPSGERGASRPAGEAGERKFQPRPPRRQPRERPAFDVAAVDAEIAKEPKYMGINRIKPRTAATLAAKAAESASDSSTSSSTDK